VKICVQGLWHLGTVTAGCLADAGFTVVGYDGEASTVAALREGRAPLVEPDLRPNAVVLISSQLPVGSVAKLEATHRAGGFAGPIHFACPPENLRLGKAIEAFTKAERIVVGVRDDETKAILQPLLQLRQPALDVG
jgi:UDPglucose 6-dehydrogenase